MGDGDISFIGAEPTKHKCYVLKTYICLTSEEGLVMASNYSYLLDLGS